LTALSGRKNQLSQQIIDLENSSLPDQDLSPPHGKLNSRIQRVITWEYNKLRIHGYVQCVQLLGLLSNQRSGLSILLTFLGMHLQPEISTAAD
jgi:hypothetical protein